TLLSAAPAGAGTNAVTWDGLTDTNTVAPDGDYDVVVAADDACGNTGMGTVRVTIDNTPPFAAIASPQAGASVGVLVDIRGSASDVHFVSYRLDVGSGTDPSVWT